MTEYSVHNCPNCGAKLPQECRNGFYTCEYCGKSIRVEDIPPEDATNTDPSKVTLTLEYDADHYLIIPDMHLIIAGKTFTIKNHKPLSIVLDKGKYDLTFKSSIRKKKITLDIDGDASLQIGWNRVTGAIKVELAQNESVAYL